MGHKSRHDPDIFQHGWLWSPTKWQPVQPTTAISLLRVKLEPLSYGTGPSWDFMCAWLERSQVKSRRKLHKVTSSNVLRVPAIIQKEGKCPWGKGDGPWASWLNCLLVVLKCSFAYSLCIQNQISLFCSKWNKETLEVKILTQTHQVNPTRHF